MTDAQPGDKSHFKDLPPIRRPGADILSDAEKLEALVRRAIERGWNCFGNTSYQREKSVPIGRGEDQYSIEEVIYDHDFARALFGEKWPASGGVVGGAFEQSPPWQYHLQQAVISKDPIDYFYQAVFGGKDV